MVYTFLSPAPMEELWEKVKNEMRPGSVFITNSFPVPVEADETIQISFGAREQRLFVHRL
jgi:hypothetical protein